MYILIAVYVVILLWIGHEMNNAPTYDEKTGRFIYRKKKHK